MAQLLVFIALPPIESLDAIPWSDDVSTKAADRCGEYFATVTSLWILATSAQNNFSGGNGGMGEWTLLATTKSLSGSLVLAEIIDEGYCRHEKGCQALSVPSLPFCSMANLG
ncbi:MAG: hypothetical protein GY813_11620 [Halieaceae bacterium]|nr:hypothetical protein [Halieaceae bacterium]